jgi:hypothetical protein
MKKFMQNNGLSVALFVLYFIFHIGTSITGQLQHNQELEDHGQPPIGYWQYVASGNFLETTMENWESEFLQMFAFVVLTTFLVQKGTSESKKPGELEAVDRDPRLSPTKEDTPWPVSRGGLVLVIYENSLSLALFLLFLISFVLHAVGGAQAYSQTEMLHGNQPVSVLQYFFSAQFWYESLQNWQSEFFSVGVLIILTIYLRQRGSSQSKPVDSPHSATGVE